MVTKREAQKLIDDMKPELDERAAAWKCGAGLLIVWLIALIGVQMSLDSSGVPNAPLSASREASQVSASAARGTGMVKTGTEEERTAQSE